MVDRVQTVGRKHDVEHPIQMTVATSDGRRLWASRYSSEHRLRSLFYSTNVLTLRELHPEVRALELLSEATRLVVSEPLGDLPGAWNEVPESSWGVIQEGADRDAPLPSTRELARPREC
ncbi:MAG TPA: hypothetical protein VGQ24_09300 [Gemmatimonadales bacterium]|jgi:predicted glutamine amidotransferase|nr:hypothetical protein [Gemmatimonadales bacterium]